MPLRDQLAVIVGREILGPRDGPHERLTFSSGNKPPPDGLHLSTITLRARISNRFENQKVRIYKSAVEDREASKVLSCRSILFTSATNQVLLLTPHMAYPSVRPRGLFVPYVLK
jgi:hypothetical protein